MQSGSHNLLALEFRPTRFVDVVGQKHVTDVMRAMVASDTVPPVLIFGGTRGTGKTSCARILASALNCTVSTVGDACGTCESCTSIVNGNNYSVLEVDAASNGGVAEMAKIRSIVSNSHAGNYRVVILDEVHSASKQAFHSLLKMLEEPPANTVFVLVTTEVDKILDTVRSRAMLFNFRRLSQMDIVQRLKYICSEKSIPAEDALLTQISVRVGGSLRDAIMLLDQMHRIESYTVEAFRERFSLLNVAPFFMHSALNADYQQGFSVVDQFFESVGEASTLVADLIDLVTDMLSLQVGGKPRHAVSEQDYKVRSGLASKTSPAFLTRVCRVLWELRTRLGVADTDQRSQVELAFVLISEIFNPTKPAAPKEEKPIQLPAAVSTPLTLEEMTKLV